MGAATKPTKGPGESTGDEQLIDELVELLGMCVRFEVGRCADCGRRTCPGRLAGGAKYHQEDFDDPAKVLGRILVTFRSKLVERFGN